ncbi:MAG: UvrD-helicase domain-containing protein [Planctomycetes bacterium]|nr:UvrD-helicase domain-containing protein [Planctomycetota bacterium]
MTRNLFADLNEPQRQAVMHVDGPLLVLAGAGSGKTRVITRRIVQLISTGVAPWNILALTFTNKAAREMRERVERLAPAKGATLCTFHALCARLLREFATEINLTRNYTIYNRDEQLRLVKEAMRRAEIPPDRISPSAAHSMISNAKNNLKTAEEFAEKAAGFAQRKIAEIFAAYERLLKENNALDFDDLLLRMAFMLRDRPHVRQQLTDRYRYILIDEYQDTNRAQYIIAHGIAAGHRNICATGDPDQSIYAWRGADVRNILEFEADYSDAVVIRLEENYRSTPEILAAASRLIARNTTRKNKSLWTTRPGGRNVLVLTCDDEHAEAAAVAQAILRRRAAGGDYNTVGIFYRINALSRVIEETLMHLGIPYRIARGVEFYNRKEIRDVLAYLKLMVNPADDLSFRRIVNVPSRGIGSVTLKRLDAFAQARGLSLLDACRHGDEAPLGKAAARKVAAFVELIDSLGELNDSTSAVKEIIEAVVSRTALDKLFSRQIDAGRDAAANVAELISAAAVFDSTSEGAGDLSDYLHEVSLISDVDVVEGGAGAVTLMTLHSAKGLEFPAVFIIGCDDGMLPFRRQEAWGDQSSQEIPPEKLEEERRLAFVGMTRAMDELTVTTVRKRNLRGRSTPQAASRFINEIAGDRVTFEDLTTPEARPRSARGGFYEDAHTREQIENMDMDSPAIRMVLDEDAPPIPPEYEHLRKGCRVHSPKFGWGKLTRICGQRWPETRVEVVFDNWGHKKLVLSKARLELLNEEKGPGDF